MPKLTRRTALGALGIVPVAFSADAAINNTNAVAMTPAVFPNPLTRSYVPKPLPFDPTKLKGISERLIVSHHDNNYVGAITALNGLEKRLNEAMAISDFPAGVYGDLKRDELIRTGSMVLHELYFANLGGDGIMAGEIKAALAQTFGTIGAWEAEFRRTAMSLAGGTGWCILALNLHTGSLQNYWCGDHSNQSATSIPLLVLDMYEHAYQMDYGAAAARYIDAFFTNINWEVVNERFGTAKRFGVV